MEVPVISLSMGPKFGLLRGQPYSKLLNDSGNPKNGRRLKRQHRVLPLFIPLVLDFKRGTLNQMVGYGIRKDPKGSCDQRRRCCSRT